MRANFEKAVLAVLVSGNNVPNQFVSGVCSYSCEGCYRPGVDRCRSDLFGEEGGDLVSVPTPSQPLPRSWDTGHHQAVGQVARCAFQVLARCSLTSNRCLQGHVSQLQCPPVPCTCFSLECTLCTLCLDTLHT